MMILISERTFLSELLGMSEALRKFGLNTVLNPPPIQTYSEQTGKGCYRHTEPSQLQCIPALHILQCAFFAHGIKCEHTAVAYTVLSALIPSGVCSSYEPLFWNMDILLFIPCDCSKVYTESMHTNVLYSLWPTGNLQYILDIYNIFPYLIFALTKLSNFYSSSI